VERSMTLGTQIRERRKESGLSVRELADRSGFSPSYLSLLERDMVNPSVAALKKIAGNLSIPVAHLMDGPERPHPKAPGGSAVIVRKGFRKGIVYPGSDIRFDLLSPDLNRKLEFLWLTVPVGSASGDDGYEHEGEECFVVIKGQLELCLGEEKYQMTAGDSVYFDSSVPHRWSNVGEEEVEAVWVITPPTF
jgi:transcriptional regulator with XRE-family HTH domain